ncbi:hypothetical protein JB92DRAFT_3095429 [Gautieria morchelliformis]|nr:hypothetical protein JB92DRAFT_3095429 [Gautieria morchelliformis]
MHDTLKKPQDLLMVSYAIRFPDLAAKSKAIGGDVTMDPEKVEQDRQRLLAIERLILETVCFNFTSKMPFPYVIKAGRAVGATKQLTNLAWRLTTDSNRTLSLLLYPPHSVALACIYLAALLLSFENTSVPENAYAGSRTSGEIADFLGNQGTWEEQFQSRLEDVQEIAHMIMDLLLHESSSSSSTHTSPSTPQSPSPYSHSHSHPSPLPVQTPSPSFPHHPDHLTRLKIFMREKDVPRERKRSLEFGAGQGMKDGSGGGDRVIGEAEGLGKNEGTILNGALLLISHPTIPGSIEIAHTASWDFKPSLRSSPALTTTAVFATVMQVTGEKPKVEVDERKGQRLTYASVVNVPGAKPWYYQRQRLVLNAYIVMLLLSNFADGYDGSMMNGLQSLTQWEEAFNFPRGSKLALLAIIQRVGGIAVLPIVPYLADGMGRRFAVFTGASIMVVGAILQASSQNVGTFIGARFLIGCGSAFATNSAPMLITEIAYPTQRAALTSSFNALWQGGAVLAAWTTFGTFRIPSSWAWRVPSAVQALPGLIQMVFVFLGPESPRWLISRGRDAQALQTLAYYHAQGDEQDPLVQYEFQEIKTALRLDGMVGWKTLIIRWGNHNVGGLIDDRIFCLQWSGNGLVAYYLSPVFNTIGITNPFTQLLVNALLSTENVIMAIGAACLCDKIGRRTLFITSTAGMLITFTLQTVFSSLYAQGGGKSMANAVVAFIFLFYASYDIAYSPLVGAYTVEILPYPLRAKGITIYYFAISLSFIFNQYANPIALQQLAWKYYVVFCCWLLFELVFVVLFVVETKGVWFFCPRHGLFTLQLNTYLQRTLEETAAIFDGEAKVKAIANEYSTITPQTTYVSGTEGQNIEA